MNKRKAKEKQRKAEKQAAKKKLQRTPGYREPLNYRVTRLREKPETRECFGREWVASLLFGCLQRIENDEDLWIRDPKDWKPVGKSEYKLIDSLLRHVYVEYPVPSCVYKTWRGNALYSSEMKAIARGESLHKLLQDGDGPRLNKKQCHLFMNHMGTKDLFPLQVFRQIQCHTAGVDGSYAINFWQNAVLSRHLYEPRVEEFIVSVFNWFGNQGMFNTYQAEPLLDYLMHMSRDANFSMKGRSMERLMQQKDEWHEEMNANRPQRMGGHYIPPIADNTVFESCGIESWETTVKMVDWSINELLNMKILRDEGKALHHCVTSYASRIVNKSVSIWSMKKTGTRTLTIEILNRSREIVQVRGLCNRTPTPEEYKILSQFAVDNNLRITC